MDALVGRYAEARLPHLDGEPLAVFERLLAVADPTLQGWIFAHEPITGSEFKCLVNDIRAFHGLDALGDVTG